MTLPIFSYTNLKAFEQCPRRFNEQYVLKLHPYQETEATKWGNYVHKALEDYLKQNTPLPQNCAHYAWAPDMIRGVDGQVYVELPLGVSRTGAPVDFWSKDPLPYIRGKFDVVVHSGDQGYIFDYKTGKNSRYADLGQLELGALMIMARYPEIQRVEGALIYLAKEQNDPSATDADRVKPMMLTRGEIPATLHDWTVLAARVETAHAAGVWQEKPNNLCPWCPCTTCPHWKPPPKKD